MASQFPACPKPCNKTKSIHSMEHPRIYACIRTGCVCACMHWTLRYIKWFACLLCNACKPEVNSIRCHISVCPNTTTPPPPQRYIQCPCPVACSCRVLGTPTTLCRKNDQGYQKPHMCNSTKTEAAMQQYETTYDSHVRNSKRKWRVSRVLPNCRVPRTRQRLNWQGSGPAKGIEGSPLAPTGVTASALLAIVQATANEPGSLRGLPSPCFTLNPPKNSHTRGLKKPLLAAAGGRTPRRLRRLVVPCTPNWLVADGPMVCTQTAAHECPIHEPQPTRQLHYLCATHSVPKPTATPWR